MGRFLAVVRPYIHSSSFLIAHIGKVVFGLALFFTIIVACKSIGKLNMDVMCVHSVMGPISLIHISSGVLVCILITVPSVLISILLSLIWKEIQQLHRAAPQQLAGIKSASEYVMIINIVFISFMALTTILLMICIVYWSKNLQPPVFYMWVYVFSHSVFGVINSFIYCVISSIYRKTFVSFHSCMW